MTHPPGFIESAEPIEFVLDFWDVPIAGIAARGAVAVYFLALFDDDLDDYSGVYEVTAVSNSTRRLAKAAALAWRPARFTKDKDVQSAWDAQRKVLFDAIATDLATQVTQHATPRFIRVNSDNFEDAFTVIWNPE